MTPGCKLCQGEITTDGHKRIPCPFCGFLYPRQAKPLGPNDPPRLPIRSGMWNPYMKRRFKGGGGGGAAQEAERHEAEPGAVQEDLL